MSKYAPNLCIAFLNNSISSASTFAYVYAYVERDSLLPRLVRVLDAHEELWRAARADREVREQNAELRRAQDAAYDESLKADEEKERLSREAARRAQALVEESARRRAEVEMRRVELEESKALLEERRALCLSLVPPEPSAPTTTKPSTPSGKESAPSSKDGSKDGTSSGKSIGKDVLRLSLQLPNGVRLTRTFLANEHTLLDLWRFVFSHPDAPSRFLFIANFPRREIDSSALSMDNAPFLSATPSETETSDVSDSSKENHENQPVQNGFAESAAKVDGALSNGEHPLNSGEGSPPHSASSAAQSTSTAAHASSSSAQATSSSSLSPSSASVSDAEIRRLATRTLAELGLGLGRGARSEMLLVRDLDA